jgi:hypothetical protein
VKTFALKHYYGAILVGNIFPYMTPDPHDLSTVGYAVAAGRLLNSETLNALHIDLMASQSYDDILVAWGVLKSGMVPYADAIYDRLRTLGRETVCLGKNKDGEPKHPGRLSGSTRFQPYERKKTPGNVATNDRAANSTAFHERPAAAESQGVRTVTETFPENTTIRRATKVFPCVECEREISIGEEERTRSDRSQSTQLRQRDYQEL